MSPRTSLVIGLICCATTGCAGTAGQMTTDDGGTLRDGGGLGEVIDAGAVNTPDSGVQADAGIIADAGAGTDGGSSDGGGSRFDGGSDGGDTSHGTDGGGVDAGTSVDAGTTGAATGPHVYYTDLTSGPNTGGEGNAGAYVSIFGAGFGALRGASTVTIGGTEVAQYRVWSDSRIAIQPGAAIHSGGAIIVTVNGVASNDSVTFTVRAGKLFFVALNGDDVSGVAGDIAHPFRHAQATLDRSDFGPGDHLILRAGTFSDVNARYDSMLSLEDGKGGTASDPIVIMAYPGERVLLKAASAQRGIHAWNSPGGVTVAGLEIDMQGTEGTPFGFPPGAAGDFGNTMQNVRAVNNEMYGMVANSGGSAAMEGRGKHFKFLGNRLHDNGGSKLYHAIYFDNNDGTGTDDIEIGWNVIARQTGGRGVQIYNSGTSGITNVSVHHNLIHDIALDGILFGDSTGVGMRAYNNVVYRTAVSALQTDGASGGCIRFNNTATVAWVANNTFVDCASDGDPDSAALRFDNSAPQGVTLLNNLIATTGGSGYVVGAPTGKVSSASNNLWFGSGAAPTFATNSVTADPQFANAGAHQYWLGAQSPAIDQGVTPSGTSAVSIDFVGTPRPQGSAFDIGAYEFAH